MDVKNIINKMIENIRGDDSILIVSRALEVPDFFESLLEKNIINISLAMYGHKGVQFGMRNKIKNEYEIDVRFIEINDIIDEKVKMKFDYIIGNPPFSNGGGNDKNRNTRLWQNIIEKAYKFLNNNGTADFIGPLGLCAPTFYKKHKINITLAESIEEGVFDIGAHTGRIKYQNKTIDELQKTGCEFVIRGDKYNLTFDEKMKYNNLPRINVIKNKTNIYGRMTLKEYNEFFDATGREWQFPKFTGQEFGIYRKHDDYFVGYIENWEASTKMKYIPIERNKKSITKAKKVAKKLSELQKEGKIHGWSMRGVKHAVIEVDNIKKDLL